MLTAYVQIYGQINILVGLAGDDVSGPVHVARQIGPRSVSDTDGSGIHAMKYMSTVPFAYGADKRSNMTKKIPPLRSLGHVWYIHFFPMIQKEIPGAAKQTRFPEDHPLRELQDMWFESIRAGQDGHAITLNDAERRANEERKLRQATRSSTIQGAE